MFVWRRVSFRQLQASFFRLLCFIPTGLPVISVDSQRSTDNITIRQGDTAVIRRDDRHTLTRSFTLSERWKDCGHLVSVIARDVPLPIIPGVLMKEDDEREVVRGHDSRVVTSRSKCERSSLPASTLEIHLELVSEAEGTASLFMSESISADVLHSRRSQAVRAIDSFICPYGPLNLHPPRHQNPSGRFNGPSAVQQDAGRMRSAACVIDSWWAGSGGLSLKCDQILQIVNQMMSYAVSLTVTSHTPQRWDEVRHDLHKSS
ncbi:Limbic system-associated membrane protein [Triplophysa tibetana]|uniref:Limbic system-associated membrane protein n=1 Tax=Triplophysa tibetana TaxID=1572043 RepID=A0A5A9MWV0_9TELE|nr:Limbic system-associated membrane protein [Triplophysa tibetana]